MTEHTVRVHRNTYLDSVHLLAGSRAILETPGVDWAAALTGTPANVNVLTGEGFDPSSLTDATANDLILAARGVATEDALTNGERVLFETRQAEAAHGPQSKPTTLEEVVALDDGFNVALISVAGDYATLEAHKALSAGLNVMLFSENVTLEAEVGLKARGEELTLLVMGPGAGTTLVGGVGLGFANSVRRGPVGIVAAAGTGAQEVMSLLHQWGSGVSHAIGVGGRDLSDAVDGRMASLAIEALEENQETEVLVVVSKPPSAEVARRLLDRPHQKPMVAALIGLADPIPVPKHVRLVTSLEHGVREALDVMGIPAPPEMTGLTKEAGAAVAGLEPERTAIRGLFSGGTLCYEAMTIMSKRLPEVYSNTPLRDGWHVSAAPPTAHVCLDQGEEEYTRGRPHPMIDAEGRTELIEREARAPETAVILIDVVLGYGSHPDPAAVLAPACEAATSSRSGPRVVAYVLGTNEDPQHLDEQRRRLQEVGCIVAPTNARAALMATAIATRRSETCEETP